MALSFAFKGLAPVFVKMMLGEESVMRRGRGSIQGGRSDWGSVPTVSHQSVSIKPTLLAAKVIVNNSANTGIVVTF